MAKLRCIAALGKAALGNGGKLFPIATTIGSLSVFSEIDEFGRPEARPRCLSGMFNRLGKQNMRHLRFAPLVISMALFALCLSKTAYETPGYMVDGVQEIVPNSSWINLEVGWLGLPIALWSLFYPYPFVIIIVASAWCYRIKYPHLGLGFAAIAAVSMLFTHTWALSSWLANVLLLLSWILIISAKARLAFYLSSAASLLSLSFLSIGELPFGPKDAFVPIWSFREGYWLWVLASATMAFGSGALWWHERRDRPATDVLGTKEET